MCYMKQQLYLICLIEVVISAVVPYAWSEVIVLKNGKTIEGKIVQASTEAITVDYYGSKVTYKLSEIDAIDGKKITYSPPQKPSSAIDAQQREYVSSLMQGQEYLQKGQYNEAIAAFRQALSLNPSHISAYSGLAAAYLSLKQFDEAVFYCDKGIAVDSEFPNIYGIRGQAKFFLRNYDEAENDLKKSIALLEKPSKYPANPSLLEYVKSLLNAVKQQREYESRPQKTTPMSQEESVEIKYLRHLDQAKNYIAGAQYLQAIQECEKAIALNEKEDQAYLYLGQAYEAIGRYKEAQEAYQKAIVINANNAQAYYNLAILYSRRLRDNQTALEYLEKALGVDPEYAEAHHNLAILYASRNNVQKATGHYRKAIELFEKKGQPFFAKNVKLEFERFSSQQPGSLTTAKAKSWSRWLDISAKFIFIGLLAGSVIAVVFVYRKSSSR